MGFFDELKKAAKEGIKESRADQKREEEERKRRTKAIMELQERERKEHNKR